MNTNKTHNELPADTNVITPTLVAIDDLTQLEAQAKIEAEIARQRNKSK